LSSSKFHGSYFKDPFNKAAIEVLHFYTARTDAAQLSPVRRKMLILNVIVTLGLLLFSLKYIAL
jgi:hypothetical protein